MNTDKYILCQNCGKKLFIGDKIIKAWIGMYDGDYDYFCSEECYERYGQHYIGNGVISKINKGEIEWIIL